MKNIIQNATKKTRRNLAIGASAVAAVGIALGIGFAFANPVAAPTTAVAETNASVQIEDEGTLGVEDVKGLLNTLEYGGSAITVDGETSVVVKDGHTWVTQKVTEADPASEVATCAKGSAALSSAIGTQTVEDEDPTGVTWVVEGPDGNVDIALTQPPEASADGSLSDALEESNGYTMNDECLDAAKKEAPEAEASKGTSPTLPDGSDVKVDEAAPEPEQTAKQEDSKSDTPTTSGSKGDSSDSSSSKDSSSGNNSGSTSGSKPTGGSSSASSGGNGSSGNSSSSAPSAPAKQKTWVDEVGHWEQQQTGQNWVPWQYREYTLYTCAGCGFSTESEDAIGAHQIQAVKDYYNNGSHSAEANYYAVPKSEKIGGGYYEPVYENVWVVDSPGHWE